MKYIYPIIAYLIGAIPFGLILSNLFGKGNLRTSGSGNIGATNVVRTQGKLLGFTTFALDFVKGFIPCFFFDSGDQFINLITSFAPIYGHMFPIFLRFKGGKGIASYFGLICAINPLIFLGTIVVWIIAFSLSKISAVGGLCSTFASVIIYYFAKSSEPLPFFNELYALLITVAIIFIKHYSNIQRLLKKPEQ